MSDLLDAKLSVDALRGVLEILTTEQLRDVVGGAERAIKWANVELSVRNKIQELSRAITDAHGGIEPPRLAKMHLDELLRILITNSMLVSFKYIGVS